jgi:hypothetical protein
MMSLESMFGNPDLGHMEQSFWRARGIGRKGVKRIQVMYGTSDLGTIARSMISEIEAGKPVVLGNSSWNAAVRWAYDQGDLQRMADLSLKELETQGREEVISPSIDLSALSFDHIEEYYRWQRPAPCCCPHRERVIIGTKGLIRGHEDEEHGQQCLRCGDVAPLWYDGVIISLQGVKAALPSGLDPSVLSYDPDIMIRYVEQEIDEVREEDLRLQEEIFRVHRLPFGELSWDRKQRLRSVLGRRRFRHYDAYLLTSHWGRKRRAIVPDGRVCTAQRRCAGALAEVAHHRSYDDLYDEPLWDLEGICRPCHQSFHPAKDMSERRISRMVESLLRRINSR